MHIIQNNCEIALQAISTRPDAGTVLRHVYLDSKTTAESHEISQKKQTLCILRPNSLFLA